MSSEDWMRQFKLFWVPNDDPSESLMRISGMLPTDPYRTIEHTQSVNENVETTKLLTPPSDKEDYTQRELDVDVKRDSSYDLLKREHLWKGKKFQPATPNVSVEDTYIERIHIYYLWNSS
uniref:Neur_chan_LBD domain-containing protein n=1 Tax=Heterorhabditis bacteriophora TaxID=37862 RepID=A0A1I7XGF3_HETBA